MIYLELFLTFFKVGLFTFGGGYAMFPLIHDEVLKNNWLSEDILINFVAISESTPGPFAVNISTYIGSELAGFWGAVCATLGVILPSFIIILVVAKFFNKFKNNKIIKRCMNGLKPCVVGLIGSVVVSMIMTVFLPKGLNNFIFNMKFVISFIVFCLSLILIYKKIHPVFIIILSCIIGIFGGIILL